MARQTIGLLLVSLAVLAAPSLARAQDGVSQRIDPTAPRGTAPAKAATQPAATATAATTASKSKTAALAKTLDVPFGEDAATSPPVGPDVHFARSSHADCSGAFFRKVKSAESSSYVGIETVVTLPRVNGFDPEAKPLVAPSVYVGGNGGQELDIGLSWDKARDARGNELTDSNGKTIYAFRPFARYSGMTWWTNSPNAPAHKGDWASNSKQYFYPGEQVRMSVKVTANRTIELEIQSTSDASKSLDKVFNDVPGFAPGHATEWKRVHSIDESGRENKTVVPTSTSLTNGHWDEVRLLLRDGTTQPMVGSAFTDVPGGDFHKGGTIDAALYNSVFKPATASGSSWGWTQDGGEAIDVEPSNYFAK